MVFVLFVLPRSVKSPNKSSIASPTSEVLAVEHVIRGLEHDQLLRLDHVAVEPPHLADGATSSSSPWMTNVGFVLLRRPRVVVVVDGRRDRQQQRDPWIGSAPTAVATHAPNDMPAAQIGSPGKRAAA